MRSLRKTTTESCCLSERTHVVPSLSEMNCTIGLSNRLSNRLSYRLFYRLFHKPLAGCSNWPRGWKPMLFERILNEKAILVSVSAAPGRLRWPAQDLKIDSFQEDFKYEWYLWGTPGTSGTAPGPTCGSISGRTYRTIYGTIIGQSIVQSYSTIHFR